MKGYFKYLAQGELCEIYNHKGDIVSAFMTDNVIRCETHNGVIIRPQEFSIICSGDTISEDPLLLNHEIKVKLLKIFKAINKEYILMFVRTNCSDFMGSVNIIIFIVAIVGSNQDFDKIGNRWFDSEFEFMIGGAHEE